MTTVSLIVAASDDGIIGRDNGLPWKLSTDLRRFKALTLGKPIIMGRRTYQSIGRPLADRHNIVISRAADFRADGATVVRSLDAALEAAGAVPEVMVIGGAEIYSLALAIAQRLYLTRVHGEIAGDTRLQGFDPAQWREISRETVAADERNSHASTFYTLERR